MVVVFLIKFFFERRGLSHHLYSHPTRGDIAPKENDQVIPDMNTDDVMDNETARNFLDGDSKGSNNSKGSIDSVTVK